MTREASIIELGAWLRSPPGRYLLAWEQDHLDQAVTDAFGFHAVQLGLPDIEGLRANRMPHRWVASDSLVLQSLHQAPQRAQPQSPHAPPSAGSHAGHAGQDATRHTVQLHCEFDALPFPDASVDLVVMPHALELARDPHLALREVERVLVPEGRVVIVGFNPASLWGLRQRAGHARQGIGVAPRKGLFLPSAGEFLGYWRLRDWLRLLSFEVEAGSFGCWRPPLSHEAWLDRFDWMDRVGERWWPVLGAVYMLVAVKRVRGMRLVGLMKRQRRQVRHAAVAVAQRRPVVVVDRAAIDAAGNGRRVPSAKETERG